MTSSFRPHIVRLAGYVPGEQPQGGGYIKLNTNENPYPPSPRVLDALSRALTDRLRLYPDPVATEFRRAAAALHGVEPDMILAGNGSDDLLTILTRSFVGQGDLAAYPTPSYLLYSTLIRLEDGREHVVPYTPEWMLNLADFDQPDLKLVYLANPNSPSGTSLSRNQVAELACALLVRWSLTRLTPTLPRSIASPWSATTPTSSSHDPSARATASPEFAWDTWSPRPR